jgi:diacylglycerol kinase family enzyme
MLPAGTLRFMRALLVVNPQATATTRRGRDILARALGSEVRVDVAQTLGRGHAIALARQATSDKVDLVVALGGDGTVNEVVNGLLADGACPQVPALAVVPGGSANVFSRALGAPRDPIEATSAILDALRAGRSRRVGLGKADDRWFTFNAGFGFDAEVIARVERHRRAGRGASPGLYVRSAVGEFFLGADRRHPRLTLHRPGDDAIDALFFAIVSNASPWTYLGNRPVNPTPGASFDGGLDLFAMRSMHTLRVLRVAYQALRRRPRPRGRYQLRLHDALDLTLTADQPVGLQVDGDFVGQRRSVRFTAVPDALRVVA